MVLRHHFEAFQFSADCRSLRQPDLNSRLPRSQFQTNMNENLLQKLSTPKALVSTKSTPNRQPKILTQKVLSGLFTKEFLNNVKNQLQKTKSPRSRQFDSISQITQLSQHKSQIQHLRKKVKFLTQENEELKFKLGLIEKCQFQSSVDSKDPNKQRQQTRKSRLKIFPQQVNLVIGPEKEESEVQKLREKVENLQMYKSIKEKRFQELLQKSARYESEIMLLKVKEQDLQSQVKALRQTIRIHVTDMNGKPLRFTNMTQKVHQGNSQTEINLPFQKQELRSMLNYVLTFTKKYSNNMLISQCNELQVPDELHISRMILKSQLDNNEEFNEIDYLIGQQLPFLKVSQELLRFNVKPNVPNGKKVQRNGQQNIDMEESFNYSPVYCQADSNPITSKNQLDQSLVMIQLNNPAANSSVSQDLQQDQSKLNQSLVAINLNDF